MEKSKKVFFAIFTIVVCSASAILIAGYNGYIPLFNNQEGENFQITDMFGREVSIPINSNKIIATGAGALRYVAYLQSIDKIVGVENIEKDEETDPSLELRPYNLAYPELRTLPSIGPMWGGEPELITTSGANIVITTNYEQAADLDSLQTQIGMPVIGLIYGDLTINIEILWQGLNLTAQVLEKTARFDEFKQYVSSIISDLNNRTLNVPENEKKSCYVGGIGYRGTHGIISTKSNYDSLLFINANNVAAGLGVGNFFIDEEQILEWNPEVLFIDGGGYNLMKEDIDSGIYDTVDAVQSEKIYVSLPYNWYTANFANILINAYFMGKVLYPSAFSDINLNTTAAEIYDNFVGRDVFDNIMQNFKNSAGTTQNALSRLGGTFEA